MSTVSAERLAKIFVEVADTLVGEFDLIEFLHLLAERTAGLARASAVGLLLADQRGNLEFMAGSNENVKLLELFQLQNQEGPCLDAFRTARPVINADLRAAGARWPRFAPHATAAGFRSVHAFHTDPEAARAARAAREAFVASLPGDHGISRDDATAMVTTSPAEAAERFAAYAAAGATSISISPGIGSVGHEWRRQVELVAEARAMLA